MLRGFQPFFEGDVEIRRRWGDKGTIYFKNSISPSPPYLPIPFLKIFASVRGSLLITALIFRTLQLGLKLR